MKLNGILFLAILAGGFFAWHSLGEIKATAAEAATRDSREIERLRGQTSAPIEPSQGNSSRLAAVGGPLTAEQPPAPQGFAGGLRTVASLVEQGMVAVPNDRSGGVLPPRPNQGPAPAYSIDSNGKLAPGFGALFGLTAEAEAALQSGLNAIAEESELAIRTAATVTRDESGAFVLQVQPTPGAAERRERYAALLQRTLGDDGFAAFATFQARRPGDTSALPPPGNPNFFGEEPMTYTLTKTATGYSIRITRRNGGGSGSSGGGTAGIRDGLIQTHGAIMKLLPADF